MAAKKIIASDYKGKWFVLQDEDIEDDFSNVRPEIDIEWVTGEGLYEHVVNCGYYGISSYIGDDAGLKARIKKIEDKLFPPKP